MYICSIGKMPGSEDKVPIPTPDELIESTTDAITSQLGDVEIVDPFE